jgi:mono/diheme cytochrome c family protein
VRCAGRLHALAASVLISMLALPVTAEEVTPDLAPGREVYLKWCAPCHAPGITHPGTHALMTKYQGVKSGVLLEWTDLPASTVKYTVRHGISVMPQFRKTEISDAELDALARYLSRNTPQP